MTYLELARKIKSAYKELKQDEVYKLFNIIWNNDLGESEITVENDAGFRAIIIGNTSGVKKSRGYMYLFYTNDDTESFPTIKEIEHRLKVIANQEILTDNSYCGQIVMMTYPLIGNYGINRDDNESMVPCVFGFVVKDYCEFPSNFRCSETLDDFLKRENIPGIYDIDTREITMKIRNVGTMKAVMADVDANVDAIVAGLKAADFLHDQVARVSTNKVFPIPNRGKKVVLMDFGAKLGIVRELSKRGCDLVIVPYDTPASTILSYRPDGVMLSNGPGDPTDVKVAIETI